MRKRFAVLFVFLAALAVWAQQVPRFRAAPHHVVVFEAKFYAGLKEAFGEDVPDLKGTLIGNDRIRSLRVPKGYEVTLYEHSGFRGRQESFSADDPDLSDNRIGLDRVSSLKLRKLEPSLSDSGG